MSYLVSHANLNAHDCKKLFDRLLPAIQKASLKKESVIFGVLSALLARLPEVRFTHRKLLKVSVPYTIVQTLPHGKGGLVRNIIGNEAALKVAMTDMGTCLHAIVHALRHWWAKPTDTLDYLGQIAVADVLLHVGVDYAAPLTLERLLDWQALLFPAGYSGIHKIEVGALRKADDMCIVFGRPGKETVHYQALPAHASRLGLV